MNVGQFENHSYKCKYRNENCQKLPIYAPKTVTAYHDATVLCLSDRKNGLRDKSMAIGSDKARGILRNLWSLALRSTGLTIVVINHFDDGGQRRSISLSSSSLPNGFAR